jgi:nucleoside-diphosphate-sugar epimerase
VGVYGPLQTWPANEETVCKPQSIYGETKLAGEVEVRKFGEATGFPVVILRPAWVYGPGCPRTLKIYKTLRKGRFVMIGKGQNLRHPIYISDMLFALHLSMDCEPAVGETFIIGGEDAITTNELVKAFCNALDLPNPKVRIPLTLGKVAAWSIETLFSLGKKEPPLSRRSLEFFHTNNSFKISKAKKILGFTPAIAFEDGLRHTRPWLASYG